VKAPLAGIDPVHSQVVVTAHDALEYKTFNACTSALTIIGRAIWRRIGTA
jgi:hypothetical protein